jgi:hypothetical protein
LPSNKCKYFAINFKAYISTKLIVSSGRKGYVINIKQTKKFIDYYIFINYLFVAYQHSILQYYVIITSNKKQNNNEIKLNNKKIKL